MSSGRGNVDLIKSKGLRLRLKVFVRFIVKTKEKEKKGGGKRSEMGSPALFLYFYLVS